MRRELDVDRLISNVMYLCDRNEMSVLDLSRVAEVSGNTMYNLVHSKHIPAITTLVKVADALDISMDDLLFTDYAKLEEEIKETQKRLEELNKRLGREL